MMDFEREFASKMMETDPTTEGYPVN